MKKSELELTILMPCLDEAETLATCIKKAQTYIDQNNVNAEILIADNGSTDGSQEIARKLDARVIDVPRKGYGSALIAGIEAAKGKYVIMGDEDDSYDFLNLSPYMEKLRDGYDLVMGNRFRGGIKDNAMPPLHKYIGNPVLSFIGKLFFKIKVDDFHCGLRGFNRERISQLNLVCTGMEFASEMVVKSSLNEYTMAEVPTILSPDGRTRPPHLRSWRDGWRHLQFLLIFSPRWLFLYPGMVLLIVGLIGSVMLARQPVPLGSVTLDIHTLLFMAGSTITGLQLVCFSILGNSLGAKLDLLPDDPLFNRLKKHFSTEGVLVIGAVVFLAGIVYAAISMSAWQQAEFGILNPTETMRKVIPAITLVISGVQVFFSAFFFSLIESFSTVNRRS